MKILQLIFSLSSGGAEKFTVDLSNELSKNNEVFFCMIRVDRDKDLSFFKSQLSENVYYINLHRTKGINLKTFFTIFKLIKKIKPDIIHAHLNTILYLYLPALLFKNRIKFIHTIHSIAPKTIGFKWQKKINNVFYKNKIINVVAISQEIKKSFIDFYGHQYIDLIENGVSNPKKSIQFNDVKEEIFELKQKPSDKVFIHIASYSEAKNQKLLIKVFNKLIEEDKGIILLVIGKHFDSENAKKLKNISKKGIYFLGTRTNISDYLFNSDVFVLSSLWEGLPISLLEALSCGIIPVCTPAGGIPDVIKDESIGYISKNFKEQEFYNSVKKSIDNIEYFDRKVLKKYYTENFSIENCARNYQLIYKIK